MNVVVGIDIGGTNTVLGVVNQKGEILVEDSFDTRIFDTDIDFVRKLVEKIKVILSQNADFKLVGIGIGAPNGNYYTGKIESAPNIKWAKNVNLVKMLSQEFDTEIKLTNDANAAALGEMLYGSAKNIKDFILITLGTGLGSGFVVNGELVLGHDGFAGELGHVNAVSGGRFCGCGRQGCLETYVSATGIRTTVLEMMRFSNDDSILRKIPAKEIDSKVIFEAAKKGDKLALNVFDFTAKVLGEKLADIVAITSPKAIIFFGGLAAAGDILFPATKKYMEKNLMPIYRNKVIIKQSALMNKNASVLGASALIWK